MLFLFANKMRFVMILSSSFMCCFSVTRSFTQKHTKRKHDKKKLCFCFPCIYANDRFSLTDRQYLLKSHGRFHFVLRSNSCLVWNEVLNEVESIHLFADFCAFCSVQFRRKNNNWPQRSMTTTRFLVLCFPMAAFWTIFF